MQHSDDQHSDLSAYEKKLRLQSSLKTEKDLLEARREILSLKEHVRSLEDELLRQRDTATNGHRGSRADSTLGSKSLTKLLGQMKRSRQINPSSGLRTIASLSFI